MISSSACLLFLLHIVQGHSHGPDEELVSNTCACPPQLRVVHMTPGVWDHSVAHTITVHDRVTETKYITRYVRASPRPAINDPDMERNVVTVTKTAIQTISSGGLSDEDATNRKATVDYESPSLDSISPQVDDLARTRPVAAHFTHTSDANQRPVTSTVHPDRDSVSQEGGPTTEDDTGNAGTSPEPNSDERKHKADPDPEASNADTFSESDTHPVSSKYLSTNDDMYGNGDKLQNPSFVKHRCGHLNGTRCVKPHSVAPYGNTTAFSTLCTPAKHFLTVYNTVTATFYPGANSTAVGYNSTLDRTTMNGGSTTDAVRVAPRYPKPPKAPIAWW